VFLVKLRMDGTFDVFTDPLGSTRLPPNPPILWRRCGGAGNPFPRPRRRAASRRLSVARQRFGSLRPNSTPMV